MTSSSPLPLSDASQRVVRALGPDCVGSPNWRVSASTDNDRRFSCTVRYGDRHLAPGLPGGWSLAITMEHWGSAWRARPDTSTLTAEQSEFWQALADRPTASGFDGFTLQTSDLLDLLDEAGRDQIAEALRLKAALRETDAFQLQRDAAELRALVRKVDRRYACAVKVSDGHFTSADGRVSIRQVAVGDEHTPPGAWQVFRSDRRRPAGDYPYWHPTRRAADDAARRLLAALTPPAS